MSENPSRKRKGKHPEKALSATRVRALTLPGRYIDGNGLYLIVEPSGAKRWLLRTVIRGKRSDLGLGGLSVVSLAQARDEAARLRRLARADGDPIAERRNQRRVVLTFEEAARRVHESHAEAFRNAKHKAQWINSLDDYAFPVFGDRRVDQIESADVLKALSAIWLSKPETARRVRQRIKAVFDWAKASGFRTGDNPVEGIAKVLPKQRDTVEHHASLPYGQVAAFIQALQDSDAGGLVKLAFELLILTATRTSEVLKAQWPEFDLEGKTWTIPGERMKAGRVFRIPLSARCVEILEAAKKLAPEGADYVFPGQSAKHPLSNMVFLMTLRRMGRKFTAHGFRSSFRNWGSERTNFPREVCEMALAHTLKDKTEAAYNRTDLFEKRRKLMYAWASFVTAPAAKVVKIRA
jgi:integrase